MVDEEMKLCGKGLHDLDDPAVAYIRPSTGERQCGPCMRAYGRVWVATHRERVSATDKARYAADPERVNAANRAWREANPERVHMRARAYAKDWVVANPERAYTNRRKQNARRRARIANVLATLTAAEWEAILDAAGRACIYCGSQEHITQDHLIPISRGGDHTTENVAPACLPCNQSKGAKVVAEFLAEAV